MNMDSLWTFYARAGYVFNFLLWLIFGGTAALWWVPRFMGTQSPLTWQLGAAFLILLWALVFNQWPRYGTRRFFRESRFLKFEISLLVFISCLFAAGFAFAA